MPVFFAHCNVFDKRLPRLPHTSAHERAELRVSSDVTELNWTDTVYFLTNLSMDKQDEPTSYWLARTCA